MHIPVLLKEVLHFLAPKEGGLYVDATFGGGGYTKAILDTADVRVIAFDKDPDAIERGQALQKQYRDRLRLVHDSFSNMSAHIHEPLHGVVFDFGVSSFQLDEGDRGFSFQKNGPLDMRMSKQGTSAADIVNSFKEEDLADIIYHYGDERKARVIAHEIVRVRRETPFLTTFDLATVVRKIVKHKDGIDPSTKTFQALRIYINNELIDIRDALENTLSIMQPGSILVGVTFHSLEDKLLKQFILKNRFSPLTKVVQPTRMEVISNVRSRSAKLRAAKFLGEQD
jgi:16S rRNA (cytosine1402-N4)-methyltransferase